VRGLGILHEQHVTGGGVASAKHPSFLAVNTALGNLKTALAGTYHAFGFDKYANRYLGQVQYLFNRRFNLRSILERLARAACQATPCPLRAVRAAELPCLSGRALTPACFLVPISRRQGCLGCLAADSSHRSRRLNRTVSSNRLTGAHRDDGPLLGRQSERPLLPLPFNSCTSVLGQLPLAAQAHASKVSFLARPRTHTVGHEQSLGQYTYSDPWAGSAN
jgi:hypothetical protein